MQEVIASFDKGYSDSNPFHIKSEIADDPFAVRRMSSASHLQGSKARGRSCSTPFLPDNEESTLIKLNSMSLIEDGKMRCLIANDEQLQLSILEMSFQNFGFVVETAQNGFEAFEIVQKNFYKGIPFDLIILDLNMPIADGYEAIKNINNLFDDNKLMNLNASPVQKMSSNQNGGKRVEDKPIIIACTGFVDEEVIAST